MNSRYSVRMVSSLNGSTNTPSTDALAKSSRRSSSVVKICGISRECVTVRGWGSNVITHALSTAPALRRAASESRMARWPRCTPSKTPIVTAVFLGANSRSSSSVLATLSAILRARVDALSRVCLAIAGRQYTKPERIAHAQRIARAVGIAEADGEQGLRFVQKANGAARGRADALQHVGAQRQLAEAELARRAFAQHHTCLLYTSD